MSVDDDLGLVVEFREARQQDVARRVRLRSPGSAQLDPRSLQSLVLFDPTAPRRSRSGWWWSSTTGSHVQFTSKSERDCLLVLDGNPSVGWITHSPVAIRAAEVQVTPPFGVMLNDGPAFVLSGQSASPEHAGVVLNASQILGWDVLTIELSGTNHMKALKWLAAYRHPRCRSADRVLDLLGAFQQPSPLMATVGALGPTEEVLPTLYHLMWVGHLQFDSSDGLRPESLVWTTTP